MGTSNKKTIWHQPWGFAEGFTIAAGLYAVGLLIEYCIGSQSAPTPQWPANIVVGVLVILLLLFIHFAFGKNMLVKWLSGIPASISAITLFALQALIMGLVPEDILKSTIGSYLGFDHLRTSWPFLLSSFFLLTTLGLTAIKRFTPFTNHNFGFVLSHAGLWITIFSASLGSSDLIRLQINTFEGKTTNFGYNENGKAYLVPFEITLHNFSIDEFPSKLVVVDAITNKAVDDNKNNFFLSEKGAVRNMLGYKLVVDKYYHQAFWTDSVYETSTDSFAAPAALISVYDKNNQFLISGWVSCGSYGQKPAILPLNTGHYVAMTFPQPKRFSSLVSIKTKKSNADSVKIEVNKPYTIKGWKIYQLSYDEQAGKLSQLSILEAVRDPWQPIVYTGVFMLIGGAFYMFWWGNKKNDL